MAEFGRAEAVALARKHDIVLHRHPMETANTIIAAIIDAHAAGRKQMREEAAQVCDYRAEQHWQLEGASTAVPLELCAAAIRALPD